MNNDANLPPSISVSSTINSTRLLQKAELLAAKIDAHFAPDINQCETDTILCYTEHGLQLHQRRNKRKRMTLLLFVDFVYGKNGFRLAKNCTTKQPLARAVGIKPGFRPTVFDGTAGLGGDSFVLASLGCKVTLCERSSVIGALLEDGLERALADSRTRTIVSENMHFISHDTIGFLQREKNQFDTVYLDPMYPHRDSSALGKKTMRTIRAIVGDDLDSEQLIQAAQSCATSRIVVKRPAKAPLLSARTPDHVIKMKSSRYDVYFERK